MFDIRGEQHYRTGTMFLFVFILLFQAYSCSYDLVIPCCEEKEIFAEDIKTEPSHLDSFLHIDAGKESVPKQEPDLDVITEERKQESIAVIESAVDENVPHEQHDETNPIGDSSSGEHCSISCKEENCMEDRCIEWICTPRAQRCAGGIIQNCNSTGTQWVRGCEVSLFFYCRCQGNEICAPGTKQCNGNQVEVCDTDGLKWVQVNSCTSEQICSGGICKKK